MEYPSNKKQKLDRMINYKKYIQTIIASNILQPGTAFENVDPLYVMMPDVIFWDFEHQLANNKGLDFIASLKCPECEGRLWTLPKSKFQLRLLYCIKNVKLLVTTVLQCIVTKKHEFLGYDARLLKQLSLQIEIPFKLFHRAGITQELMENIFLEVSCGLQIKQLHDSIAKNYSETYQHKSNIANQNNEMNTILMNDETMACLSESHSGPSQPLISQCFLANFEEKNQMYKNTMSSIESHGMVFIDDTFGLQLTSGSKHKLNRGSGQSSKVLFIMNEKQQVVHWNLTGENLKDVISFLESSPSLQHVTGCVTTHCCEWSDELKQYFGDVFLVKANLINILDTLAQRHIDAGDSKHVQCLRELESVFCGPDDLFENRQSPTVSPATIETNFTKFLIEWEEQRTSSGDLIISEDFMKELLKMKEHATKGCFSDIPPALTNISGEFSATRVKLESWTSNIHFGIAMVTAIVSIGFHGINKERGVEDVPAGVESVQEAETKPKSPLDVLLETTSTKIEVSETDVHRHVIRFLMYLKCFKSVSFCAPDLLGSPQLLPHFVSSIQLVSVPYFSKASEMNEDYFNDVEKLRCLINWTNRKSVDDSVTFITSFVNHLQNLVKADPTEIANYATFLQAKLGIDLQEPLDSVVENSKGLLQSSGAHAHVPFMGLSFAECVSNLFGVVFLFVTNLKRFPIVPIYPVEWFPDSPFILVLIEEEDAMVMLDPASLVSQNDDSAVTKKKNFNCRCGRGQAERNLPPKCVAIEGARYRSRCYCFRAGEPCSDICDCRACANPHGAHLTRQRSIVFDQTQPVRKRNEHVSQRSFKKISTRYLSMSRRKKDENKDWNYCEYLLFDYVLNDIVEEFHLKQDGLLTWSNLPVLVELIHGRYGKIADELRTFDSTFKEMIRNKEVSTLESRYKQRQEYVNTKFEE